MKLPWPKANVQPSSPTSAAGTVAERVAEDHLKAHGLKTRARNFSCPQGEIDLVMEEPDTLIFVEVRFRKGSRFGTAVETVTQTKQRKIHAAAQQYIATHRSLQRLVFRFDIVGITLSAAGEYDIQWIPGAFDAPNS